MKRFALVCALMAMAFCQAAGQKNVKYSLPGKYEATAHSIYMKAIAAGAPVVPISMKNSDIGPDGKEIPEDGYVLQSKYGGADPPFRHGKNLTPEAAHNDFVGVGRFDGYGKPWEAV